LEKPFKVTRKFQITIPREVREKLHIMEGDLVKIHEEGKKIIIEPVTDRSGDWLEDMLSLFDKPVNLDAVKLVEESWDGE
jgi:antitoxin PrlF